MTPAMEQKLALYHAGVSRARQFCHHNKIVEPDFILKGLTKNRSDRLDSTGLYDPDRGPYGTVFVNLPECASPVHKPHHMCWSWPAYKTDRTPMGVVCHEVGHHFQFRLMKLRRWTRNWTLIAVNTPKITSYEPVPSEAFAETMRLFILNPVLLWKYSPKRYEFIVDVLGLEPIEERDPYQVVGNVNYNKRLSELLK